MSVAEPVEGRGPTVAGGAIRTVAGGAIRTVAVSAIRTVAVSAILALAGSPALGASPALAAMPTPPTPTPTPPAPTLTRARLQGQFLLAGRVTVANNVRGEHVGQKVTRTWTFVPGCPAGACATIGLLRRRVGGSDQLVLRRRDPGYYTGTGSFFAPLKCGSRTYPKGSAVPFTITVRVTAATLSGAAVVATRINASYTNRSRSNLTPCPAFLGHDAATYHGHVAPPTAPGAGAGAGAGT
jgi:hypothetical protein